MKRNIKKDKKSMRTVPYNLIFHEMSPYRNVRKDNSEIENQNTNFMCFSKEYKSKQLSHYTSMRMYVILKIRSLYNHMM